MPLRLSLLCTLLLLTGFASADELESTTKKKKDDRYPDAASAKDSAEIALKKFAVAPGLQVDVWASEPLLANPVAFSFDDRGRAFVAETYRRRSTVPDIRRNEPWQIENLALRSTAERLAFFKSKYPESAKRKPTKDLPDFNGDGQFDWRDWEVESERIKLVIDKDGDGKADAASVFADDFKTALTGVGAGVLAHGGSVFYTCTPDLWRLHVDKDGAATKREALLTGFGAHVVFSGHDMHGLRVGPDGRLYWTIADCGARVETKEGTVLDCPDSGAVFRCDPDGRNAEIVAVGLRNPQHLAWNDVGDLFTGDNNADGADKARWTHIVDGGDYGWRLGWQFMKKSDTQPQLGPWNAEGMWHLDVDKTNLSLLPPVGHIGHGPAGIAHYPGTGLPDAYRDHFFYADFPGGVRSFKLTPRGASYTVDNPKDVLQDNSPKNMTGKVLWGLFPSDVQFGVDGGVYVLDWIEGWEKTGKGRIFRVHDPAVDASAAVQETKRLLGEGMEKHTNEELAKLLGHADQRVRMAAQFALVERGRKCEFALLPVILSGQKPAALHAMWAFGQLARREPEILLGRPTRDGPSLIEQPARGPTTVWQISKAKDAEVRAQLARCLGDLAALADQSVMDLRIGVPGAPQPTTMDLRNGVPGAPQPTTIEFRRAAARDTLWRLIRDDSPRVQSMAAQAVGKWGGTNLTTSLFELLARNADRDPFIRHAASVALASCANAATLAEKSDDSNDAVRAGALLALRRQASPEIARFLADKDPQLALEAARGIHDGAIPAAWPQLAALAVQPNIAPPLSRRAINANYLLGNAEAAQRLAKIAADAQLPAAQRLDAIESLGIWNEPFGRDRITGLWRDLPKTRDAQAAVQAAAGIIPALLDDPNEAVRLAAAQLAGSLKVAAAEPALLASVSDAKTGGKPRAAALRALAAIQSPKLADAVKVALGDQDKTLLDAARQLAGKASPALAVQVNAAVLGKGGISEQQEALATIAAQPIAEADRVLATQLDLLIAGKLPAPLALDLLEAAALRKDSAIQQKLAAYEASKSATDPLARWSEALEGGDAKEGRAIFAEKAEAGCNRCHKVKGEGGDVGPDLAGATVKRDRAHLLQSIVEPSALITPGYENVLFTLKNGEMIAGLLSAEDASDVTVASLIDGKKQKLKKTDVKERMTVPSAMPPGLGEVLGKRALRDVIEYLATVK